MSYFNYELYQTIILYINKYNKLGLKVQIFKRK